MFLPLYVTQKTVSTVEQFLCTVAEIYYWKYWGTNIIITEEIVESNLSKWICPKPSQAMCNIELSFSITEYIEPIVK